MTFPRVLTDSGLAISEVANLYGVSRNAIYSWERGATPRGKVPGSRGSVYYSPDKFQVITKVLLNAIDKGLLPLPAMDRAARKARIAKMVERLQKAKQ